MKKFNAPLLDRENSPALSSSSTAKFSLVGKSETSELTKGIIPCTESANKNESSVCSRAAIRSLDNLLNKPFIVFFYVDLPGPSQGCPVDARILAKKIPQNETQNFN